MVIRVIGRFKGEIGGKGVVIRGKGVMIKGKKGGYKG